MKKQITFYILAFLGIAGASLCSCSNDSSDNTAIFLAAISQNNAPSPDMLCHLSMTKQKII